VISLTTADAGSRCVVTAGEVIAVILDEKPSTAYLWAFEVDGRLLRFVGDDAPAAGPAMGATRAHTFRFAAAQPGSTTLTFRLARSWEPGRPAEQFAVDVEITPAESAR
jgi:predicted secreted protein